MIRAHRLLMKTLLATVLAAAPVFAAGCAVDSEETSASEDDLVATFDRQGQIDLTKRSRILLVGDSDELGELPLYAATTKARRIAQLYPNDQIVLFITKDVREATVVQTTSTIVRSNAIGNVAMADLRALRAPKLIAALDRFKKIAALEFFGHSSPFGALLEGSGDDRNLTPDNLAILADNFDRTVNPYVALNGCNGGATLAPALSKTWRVPVSGALTASNFEVLMSDGRWYPNDDGFIPPGLTKAKKNDKSFGPSLTPSCSAGACVRMKPQDAPYYGVWSDPNIGFQYGLGFYKFFCNYSDDGSCAKGMATSLLTFPATKPIDAHSSEADFKDVLAEFICSGNKDPLWFDDCKSRLFEAVANGTGISTMRYGTDYGLECDFAKCEQQFRCKQVAGVPQQHSCTWVNATCRADQKAAACKTKNTKNLTTPHEFAKYIEGYRLLAR